MLKDNEGYRYLKMRRTLDIDISLHACFNFKSFVFATIIHVLVMIWIVFVQTEKRDGFVVKQGGTEIGKPIADKSKGFYDYW